MERSVVLVEGPSDASAIDVVAVGGFGGFGGSAAALAGTDTTVVAVLCDTAEAPWVARALPAAALHVCSVDLEDELIRALGVDFRCAHRLDRHRRSVRAAAHPGARPAPE